MKQKLSLLALAVMVALGAAAQKINWSDSRFRAGAVTQNERGVVVFNEKVEVPGKTKAQILSDLRQFVVQQLIADNPEALKEECAIVEDDAQAGLLSVRMDEYLTFKRTAWVLHRTRFLYDLLFRVSDGGYEVQMQRLRYKYLSQEVEGVEPELRTAEDWITDAEALDAKGRMIKKARQFRAFTICRKDDVFNAARQAVFGK